MGGDFNLHHILKCSLAQNTKFETPFYLIKGSRKGTTVMLTAGIHGNEKASVLAANKLLVLLKKGSIQIDNGVLILVPVVNQQAFKQNIRGIPDLNRTFPRKPNTEARHPLSRALFRLAKQDQPAWYIDLHEANGLSNVNPRVLGQTIITNPNSIAIPSVRRIVAQMNRTIAQRSKHFTVRLYVLPGSGRTTAYQQFNSRAITVETCWSLPISDRVNFQMQILRHLLNETGLIRNGTKKRTLPHNANALGSKVRDISVKER
jgi:predicted deacylase